MHAPGANGSFRRADVLSQRIPAGVGSTSLLHLNPDEIDAMLRGGARWAVERGYGIPEDLEHIEEHGCMADAQPEHVSVHAKHRQEDEMGMLARAIPADFREVGQPVLIGGSMGTCSYILAGTTESEQCAFSSAVHGAGRAMSRHQATHRWKGRQVVDELATRGILIRSPSSRGVAEEAPGAYKDVSAVVDAADHAHLARKVAKLEPVICVKG